MKNSHQFIQEAHPRWGKTIVKILLQNPVTTTFFSLFLRKLPRLQQPTQGQGRSRISTALAKRMDLPKLVQILMAASS